MTDVKRIVLPLLMMLALLGGAGLTGCTSTYEQTEVYPAEYRTMSIAMFENRTFYRGAEFELTEALAKEVQQRTPYLVTELGTADTVLQGAIVDVEENLGFRVRPGNVPGETEIRVTVDWQWKDLRTGQTIRNAAGMMAVGSYTTTTPVGEPIEVALRRAIERMATDVVTNMQADWGQPEAVTP